MGANFVSSAEKEKSNFLVHEKHILQNKPT